MKKLLSILIAIALCGCASHSPTSGPTAGTIKTLLIQPYPTNVYSGALPCGGTTLSIKYSKTIANGWGWAPVVTNVIIQAQVWQQPTMPIQYFGSSGDSGCGIGAVNIPKPPYSAFYEFAVGFNSGQQTTNLPVALFGFTQ